MEKKMKITNKKKFSSNIYKKNDLIGMANNLDKKLAKYDLLEKKEKAQLEKELHFLKLVLLKNFSTQNAKFSVQFFEKLNNKYNMHIETDSIIKKLDHENLKARKFYDYYNSNLYFLEIGKLKIDEVENKFLNLNLNIEKTNFYYQSVLFLSELAKFKNSNFEKIENGILERMKHVNAVFDKFDKNFSPENSALYIDMLTKRNQVYLTVYDSFLTRYSNKVNLGKFKCFFENDMPLSFKFKKHENELSL